MKGPIIRSYRAYFPRKISGTHNYHETMHPSKKMMDIDVAVVTKEEKDRHKEALKSIKKRAADADLEKENTQRKKPAVEDSRSTRRPISFANL